MSHNTPMPVAGGGAESAKTLEQATQITSPAMLRQIEALSATGLAHGLNVRDLLDQLSSPAGNAQALLSHNDLTYPLPNYYISSSHNTYLTGNQLSSDSSADGYTNVLLRGCRSVEIDVWNGRDADDDDDQDDGEQHHGIRERLGLHKSSGSEDHAHHKSIKERLGLGHHDRTDPNTDLSLTTTTSSTDDSPSHGRRTEPRVLHGHTLTKEVPFRRVCEAIRDAAFVTSDLPVIISLEIHTNFEQQQIMVDIMKEVWHGLLISPTPDADLVSKSPLPSPADLRRKILVKVKYSPPDAAKAKKLGELSARPDKHQITSGSDDEAPEVKKVKKRKILDSLSELGVYTHAYSFKGFDKPEAKIPTHVFSLSEKRLLDSDNGLTPAVCTHNKTYMMRAYPKALRLTSTNLEPPLFWRQGVQMAALNWQDCDKGIMLNEGMFAGTGGFMLKPASYRSTSPGQQQPTPSQPQIMDITVEVFAAQNLSLPRGKQHEHDFQPYIRSALHVGTLNSTTSASSPTSPGKSLKAHTTSGSGRNASFSSHPGRGALLSFRDVLVDEEELCFLRLKVVDDVTLGKDSLAAWACIRLDRLKMGLRIVRLWDWSGKGEGGLLLVRIEKVVRGGSGRGALPVCAQ